MSGHEDSKKEKLRKRRMKSFLFFNAVKNMLEDVDIGTPSTSKKKPEIARKNARKMDNDECAEKLATVYKSLELRKREAKDRWNRFAGTEGGGARGR